MRFSTKAITTCAVLAALALALSYLESFFPPLLPLTGFVAALLFRAMRHARAK